MLQGTGDGTLEMWYTTPVSYRVQAYLQTLARSGVPKESNKAVGVGLPVALEVGACLHLSLCPSSPSPQVL